MNLATGSLVLLGLVLMIVGVTSKLMGLSLLAPLFTSYVSYLVAANSCLLLSVIIDKHHKE